MNLQILSQKVFIGGAAAILFCFGLISYNYEPSQTESKIETHTFRANSIGAIKRTIEERSKSHVLTLPNEHKNKSQQKYAFWEKSGGNKTQSNYLTYHQNKENEDKLGGDVSAVFEDYSSSTEENPSDAAKVSYLVLSGKELSNNWHSHDNTSLTVAKRFADRRQRINELCHLSQYQNDQPAKGVRTNKVSKLANGRLTWCPIPKVGTTFLVHLRSTVDTLENGAKTKRSQSVSTEQTKRFFFVREPYSRLASGYVCKIVLTASFWPSLGTLIVKNFRTDPQEASLKCGNDVTFPEFIKYFIYSQENGWHRNLHFVPMHEQCNSCTTHYDFVGHLETFKDDFSFILQSVNLSVDFNMNHEERAIRGKARGVFMDKKIRDRCEPKCITLRKAWWSFHWRGFVSKEIEFPLSHNCSTISQEEFEEISWSAHLRSAGSFDKAKQKREVMVQLYRQVPFSDRLKLRDILKKDFDMFGYDPQPADLFPEMDATT